MKDCSRIVAVCIFLIWTPFVLCGFAGPVCRHAGAGVSGEPDHSCRGAGGMCVLSPTKAQISVDS